MKKASSYTQKWSGKNSGWRQCVNNRKNLRKRTVLPFLYLQYYLVRNSRNENLRCLKTIDVIERIGNMSGDHFLSIHGDVLLINVVYVFLTFL